MSAFGLPPSIAPERMREIIREGTEYFGNLSIYKDIIGAFGIEICASCSGEGTFVCDRCNGKGYYTSNVVTGHISLPRRYTCDLCCGRRKTICSSCNGIGIKQGK